MNDQAILKILEQQYGTGQEDPRPFNPEATDVKDALRAIRIANSDDDQIRELSKVKEAIDLSVTYHTKINEANSALHSSDKVLYSPMTNKLILAQQSLERMLPND